MNKTVVVAAVAIVLAGGFGIALGASNTTNTITVPVPGPERIVARVVVPPACITALDSLTKVMMTAKNAQHDIDRAVSEYDRDQDMMQFRNTVDGASSDLLSALYFESHTIDPSSRACRAAAVQ